MNQQHYPGGIIPSSSDSSVKRRRGRPRKEETLAHAGKLTPNLPLAMGSQILAIRPTNEVQSFIPPLQPQADLSKGKARVEDVNPKGCINDDEMIGQVVTGVLEGMFDAGYFLSVNVGESDTQLRGIVFQPGKFVPITEENDIAPGAKMYSRIDVSVAGSKSLAQAHGATTTFSKPMESVNNQSVALERQVVGETVEPVCFTLLQSTPEKNEGESSIEMAKKSSHVPMGCESSIVKEGPVYDNRGNEDATKDVKKQGLELQAEKPLGEIIIEEPSEVFMECEGFEGKEGASKFDEGADEDMVMRNCSYETGVEEKDVPSEKAINGVEEEVIVPWNKNEVVEQKHEIMNEMEVAQISSEKGIEARNSYERFGSPLLELSLSNSTFSIEVPIDLSKATEEKKLQPVEVHQKISLEIFDPLASSSVESKVPKISMDIEEGNKIHCEGDKEEHAPVVVPSSHSLEEKEPREDLDIFLQPLAKKPKIDETMQFVEAGASEPFLSPETMIPDPKELGGSQGFKDPSCELKPMETE